MFQEKNKYKEQQVADVWNQLLMSLDLVSKFFVWIRRVPFQGVLQFFQVHTLASERFKYRSAFSVRYFILGKMSGTLNTIYREISNIAHHFPLKLNKVSHRKIVSRSIFVYDRTQKVDNWITINNVMRSQLYPVISIFQHKLFVYHVPINNKKRN